MKTILKTSLLIFLISLMVFTVASCDSDYEDGTEAPSQKSDQPSCPGHIYSSDCDPFCDTCNEMRIYTTAGHEYDANCDRYCNICDTYRSIGIKHSEEYYHGGFCTQCLTAECFNL